jgi:hypothetical protein
MSALAPAATRTLDPAFRAWLALMRTVGPAREAAIRRCCSERPAASGRVREGVRCAGGPHDDPDAQLADFVPRDPDKAGCLIELSGIRDGVLAS